jgi:hypothetical protein
MVQGENIGRRRGDREKGRRQGEGEETGRRGGDREKQSLQTLDPQINYFAISRVTVPKHLSMTRSECDLTLLYV